MKVIDILKTIQKLNSTEKYRSKKYLMDKLSASTSTYSVLEEISERNNKSGYRCPECESKNIVRIGKYSTFVEGEEVKKQRSRCKACKLTFTDLINTVLYRARKLNKRIKFIEK